MSIKSDVGKCQGYGNCTAAAPEHFDVDDDGLVVVLRETVEPGEEDDVAAAVRSCPVAAIWVDDGA